MENIVERRSAVAEYLGNLRERLGYSALTSHQQQAILECNACMRICYVYTLCVQSDWCNRWIAKV